MITIIDYGCGNPASIKNMLKKIGHEAQISASPDIIQHAEKLILPGVGAFDHGMQQLHQLNLIPALHQQVLQNKVPILGICLGSQLFFKRSDEGKETGLGWIEGDVINFDKSRLSEQDKIPNMGWSDVSIKKNSVLFDRNLEIPHFYFVHSYHMHCQDSLDTLVTSQHAYEFTAGIEKGNIAGVQFHPEKSHAFGMLLLENFATKF